MFQKETFEPERQKTYLRTCVSNEDSDQPAHSRSLIRIFTERILDRQGCEDFDEDSDTDCTDVQTD